MSDKEKFGEFRREPTKSWKTSSDDDGMRCYLGMSGRLSLREILDYFAENHPDVDTNKLEFNFATVTWDEPPTPEDIAKRRKARADYAARTERWEREKLVQLKEKYEPNNVGAEDISVLQ